MHSRKNLANIEEIFLIPRWTAREKGEKDASFAAFLGFNCIIYNIIKLFELETKYMLYI